jgi:uncharacterized damage-inducible protein DinB
MPVASRIAIAAHSYHQNSQLIGKSINGLTPEEWLRRPGDSSNHMLWILGHVTWARATVLSFLGTQWSRPWLPQFARGVKLADTAEYPTPEEITLAWQDQAAQLTAAIETATEETLSKPAPERIPSADGKISGLVDFLAYHETYHVGQAAYIRRWLGHDAIIG